MDIMQKQLLTAGGINVEDALGRFMTNEMLLERFLKKFLNDTTLPALQQAIAAKDIQAALTASHTLKGMCGNLSMTTLFHLFTQQVTALREDRFSDAADMMPDILAAVETASDAIRGCWG